MPIYHDSGPSDDVLEAFTVADAQDIRTSGPRPTLSVSIGNVDLPGFILEGVIYIQAPLTTIFQAFAEDLSAFVRDLEVGISDERGAPLSLDGNGRSVPIQRMAKSRVVRHRRIS